jgi:hypothetical protein
MLVMSMSNCDRDWRVSFADGESFSNYEGRVVSVEDGLSWIG